jgi:hypothetical protein
MISKYAFAAIRKTEGKEWIDTLTIQLTRNQSATSAEMTDTVIPGWARINPIVRVVSVLITEVRE